ncbi:hypothetical protein PIB30_011881 [Stylosanthes scabra]|uniref:Transposase (Putative), gypsy type n=1 Tax=Stylosanthes scabra TaxID=79078 RepID=A0ABU6U4Q7_9FABA|nr:hypothetical protein [Stylosanthes scabra]
MGQVNWLLSSGLGLYRAVASPTAYVSNSLWLRLFIKKSEIGKKKSCQELKVPRPLNSAETRLYGWVEEVVLTQPSVVESDSLPEFCRNFPLMEDLGAEGDYVLEAAGPSDRVPFRAGEGSPHFLWVYQELFNRLRVRLPFSDFQRDVITRCRIAVSQLHLNGWGFILAFEKVCLHYGFRPTIRLFFYIYDILIPPTSFGYISFRARQGRKLFDSYEDSIQEFKWHNFKVLPAPGKRAFWLDHEDKPFLWVYWNPEVKDFTVYNLEPLEMAAFKFLVSLPGGLPKRNKFTCRWILDSSDAEVGKFLDDLLDVKMKKTKLDNLLDMMADPSRMDPRAILPTGRPSATAGSTSAAGLTPVESSSQMPPAPAASETHRWKRRKKKAKGDDAFDRVLGDDSAWEHEVDPVKLAFPELSETLECEFDVCFCEGGSYQNAPGVAFWEVVPFLCQVGVETSLAAKENVDNLDDQLSERTAEYQSALDRIAQLEDDNGVLKTQLESSQLSLEGEKKRSEAADLSKATEASEYWRAEWQKLGTEVTEMCQETLDICLDQVSHLCPSVDFFAITLKSRWDPKSRRIYVPQESDVEEEPPRTEEVVPEATTQASQPAAGDVAGASGECPT